MARLQVKMVKGLSRLKFEAAHPAALLMSEKQH